MNTIHKTVHEVSGSSNNNIVAVIGRVISLTIVARLTSIGASIGWL